jgi:Fatty acid hydroxylase superfamily
VPLSRVVSLLQFIAFGFIGTVIVTSFIEWAVHRFVMHRPVGKFDYPFKAHAVVHHGIFRGDESYHLQNEKDKETIPMAWWNGPLLIAICATPGSLVAWFMGHGSIAAGGWVAAGAYYATYEYLHWCMHLPRKRGLERSGVFFRLNGHHILHHRYMHKNFNVVFPLADLCLGTLLLRSKIAFPQPVHPAVPNLQPLEEKPALPVRVWRFVSLCLTGVK